MGVDVSHWVDIGVPVKAENLGLPFKQVTPAVYRYEDRFDPKTGQKTEPKRITLQQERVSYLFEGQTYSLQDLAEAVATYLNCQVQQHSDGICGYWNNFVFGYGSGIGGSDDQPSWLPLESAMDEFDRLKKLQIRLLELGIQAEQPSIVYAVWVS